VQECIHCLKISRTDLAMPVLGTHMGDLLQGWRYPVMVIGMRSRQVVGRRHAGQGHAFSRCCIAGRGVASQAAARADAVLRPGSHVTGSKRQAFLKGARHRLQG